MNLYFNKCPPVTLRVYANEIPIFQYTVICTIFHFILRLDSYDTLEVNNLCSQFVMGIRVFTSLYF